MKLAKIDFKNFLDIRLDAPNPKMSYLVPKSVRNSYVCISTFLDFHKNYKFTK